jgi:hypothetical protein
MTTDPQDHIARTWNEAVEQTIGSMTDADFQAMVARARPTTRQSIAAKAEAMWNTPRDENGVIGSMAAAAAGRQRSRPQQPTVETPQSQPPPDTGLHRLSQLAPDAVRRTGRDNYHPHPLRYEQPLP